MKPFLYAALGVCIVLLTVINAAIQSTLGIWLLACGICFLVGNGIGLAFFTDSHRQLVMLFWTLRRLVDANEACVRKRLELVLERPETWASSSETLEASALHLLWAIRKVDYAERWNQFCVEKFPELRRNSPIWAQREISVSDMAALLREFVQERAV